MSDEHIGERVGIFTIIEEMPYRKSDGHLLYKGVCNECGFERIAKYNDLKETIKCTHIRIDGEVAFNRTNWKNKRIASIFYSMKNRCYKEGNKEYKSCGAKGVKICDEWMDNPSKFEEWAMNNGYSDNLVIHRIDKLGNYCPENCKWVTNEYSQKRKSQTNLIEINGIEDSGAGWSERLGFGRNYINSFIRKHGLEYTILCIQNKLNGDNNAFKINKTKTSEISETSAKRDDSNKVKRNHNKKTLCKICGTEIRCNSKYGLCNDCFIKSRREEKIKHWLETGDTGTAPAQKPPDIIRKYVFDKQNGKCAICGMENKWDGKELKFIFDHIDGNAADSSISNVRLICPNCDSQLDTFKSKNKNSARQFRHKYT